MHAISFSLSCLPFIISCTNYTSKNLLTIFLNTWYRPITRTKTRKCRLLRYGNYTWLCRSYTQCDILTKQEHKLTIKLIVCFEWSFHRIILLSVTVYYDMTWLEKKFKLTPRLRIEHRTSRAWVRAVTNRPTRRMVRSKENRNRWLINAYFVLF